MKMVLAFIQPHRLDAVTRRLLHIAALPGMTVTEARGFGSTKVGHELQSTEAQLTDFTPATRVELVVRDDQVDEVVNAITAAAHTGRRGDGRVFVLRVERAVRIKTLATGDVAI